MTILDHSSPVPSRRQELAEVDPVSAAEDSALGTAAVSAGTEDSAAEEISTEGLGSVAAEERTPRMDHKKWIIRNGS